MSSNIYTQRICQYCGKDFTARTTVTKYCSSICNSRDYKKKLRNKDINVSESETSNTKLHRLVSIQDKDILSLKETALLLGISRTTLYRMRKNGIIQFTQLGNKRVVLRRSIDLLFGSSKVEGKGLFLMNVAKNS
jgi:excisionase family DNA binding protein